MRPHTCNIPPDSDLDYWGVRVVCEDTRLSMRAPGQVYLGIDLSTRAYSDIDPEEFEALLHIAAAGMDIEAMNPAGPADRKHQWEIQKSEDFQETRRKLARRL